MAKKARADQAKREKAAAAAKKAADEEEGRQEVGGGPPLPLLLGSSSPRRAALLAAAGVPFERGPAPDVDETPPAGASAEEVARRCSRAARRSRARPAPPGGVVLGADTMVVLDGEILNKPETPPRRRRMLRGALGPHAPRRDGRRRRATACASSPARTRPRSSSAPLDARRDRRLRRDGRAARQGGGVRDPGRRRPVRRASDGPPRYRGGAARCRSWWRWPRARGRARRGRRGGSRAVRAPDSRRSRVRKSHRRGASRS